MRIIFQLQKRSVILSSYSVNGGYYLLFSYRMKNFHAAQHFADDALSNGGKKKCLPFGRCQCYDAIVSKYFHIIYDETSDHKHTYMLCGSAHHCIVFEFSIQWNAQKPSTNCAKQRGFHRRACFTEDIIKMIVVFFFCSIDLPHTPHLLLFCSSPKTHPFHPTHHLILLFMQIFAYLIVKSLHFAFLSLPPHSKGCQHFV